MDEDHGAISSMRAVTLSREYGSGGGEVAVRLARRLGWQLIDHEVVVQVARRLGITEAEAEVHDERVESLTTRILNSLQMIQPLIPVVSPVPLVTDINIYQQALLRVIEGAVATGHAVIVGRGAQAILAQHRDVFHVRIVAPLEMRIAYVVLREGLNEEAARARIQLKDRDRTRYLQAEHNLNPADPHLYDLVINTGILDLDSAVDLLTLGLAHKASRLSVPVDELGPAAGLTRYPDQPGDFRPPMGRDESATP